MAKMRRRPEAADELVFGVCHAFLKGEKTEDIATSFGLTREGVYPLVVEGAARNYLLLCPPPQQELTERLATRYKLDAARVRVVATRGKAANEHVSWAGSDLVLDLMREVGARKKRVHLGLGSGWTTLQVARRLALRLRTEFSGPELVLHALSSGFDITDPLRAPVAFFGSFQNLPMKVDYFGLFVSAAVPWNMYEDVKTQPGVRESFEHAPEVDIVVTSLASAADEHGALNRFLRHWSNDALGDLMRQGWVGDVQYLPYSTKAPITVGSGVRAVTLFELADLVAMVRSRDKHVVLIGGPCGECAVSKTEALRPLLEEPSLRVWSHLVLDSGTAERLLEPAARH